MFKDYYIGQKDAGDKDAVTLLYAVHECSGASSQTKLRSYPKHPSYYFYMLGIPTFCLLFLHYFNTWLLFQLLLYYYFVLF